MFGICQYDLATRPKLVQGHVLAIWYPREGNETWRDAVFINRVLSNRAVMSLLRQTVRILRIMFKNDNEAESSKL